MWPLVEFLNRDSRRIADVNCAPTKVSAVMAGNSAGTVWANEYSVDPELLSGD